MKKLILTISILAMVMGFAGVAAAQMCMDCDEPGYINRGCDVLQRFNPVFDYNDTNTITGASYCGAKGDVHRAMLDVCECDAEWVGYSWSEIEAMGGLSIDISLEILVDDQEGNNGVYWAQEIDSTSGLMMWTDKCSDSAMCSKTYQDEGRDLRPLHIDPDMVPYPWTSSLAVDFANSNKWFAGPFIYEDIDGDEFEPIVGNKTTIMRPDPDAQLLGLTGYLMQIDDIQGGKCIWGYDMPAMWVDNSVINGGEVVTVRVTLTATDSQGLCHKDDCECIILIGTLCCPEEEGDTGKTLIFPYMPKLYGYYDAQGVAITNLTSEEGTATVTIYENDGDAFTKDVTVPAMASKNLTIVDFEGFDLKTTGAGGGVLGTASKGYYVVVELDVNASGLAFFANSGTGESMGYTPVKP